MMQRTNDYFQDSKMQTSAGSVLPNKGMPIIVPLLLLISTTTGSASPIAYGLLDNVAVTTAGSQFSSDEGGISAGKEVSFLRIETGLTWKQVSSLFGVSQRSVHFWVSGKPINSDNFEKLNEIIRVIKIVSTGDPAKNRKMLLSDKNGILPIDLLKQGKFDEFLLLLGCGLLMPKQEIKRLSKEEVAVRSPLKPDVLLNSISDPIKYQRGKVRAVKVKKV